MKPELADLASMVQNRRARFEPPGAAVPKDALPTLTGAFGWWTGELSGLFAARRRAKAAPAGLVLEVSGKGVRIAALPRELAAGQDPAGAPAVPLSEAVSVPLVANYVRTVAGPRGTLPAVTLRIRAPGFLKRKVMLPAAAEPKFADLLALDMKRATPFKRDEVYAGFAVSPTEQALQGLAAVTQVIVKRAALDDIIRELEGEGLSVARIECLDETQSPAHAIPVTLAGADDPARAPGRRGLFPLVLIAALAATAAMILIFRHESVLDGVRSEREAVQKEAAAARTALQGTEAEAQSIRNLLARQSSLKSRATILETLTRLMPDTAYVTELRIDGASIEITGLASSASALLPLLENSDLFVDARMSMPQMLDSLTKKERFGIKMRLRGIEPAKSSAGAGEEAP